jgi:hypothetical protein
MVIRTPSSYSLGKRERRSLRTILEFRSLEFQASKFLLNPEK